MWSGSRRGLFEQGLGLAAAGIGASSLRAQDWARQAVDKSPRKREWVTVKQGSRNVETFIAHPQGSGKAPGILIIHEIFGLSEWVESVADEFAAAGFLAIAPDLLSGMGPKGGRTKDIASADVMKAITSLPQAQVTADLNAVADYLLKQPGCNGKICVTGFSWGGSQCFQFATTRKDLSASFVFYGTGPEPAAIANIKAPVYGFYGGSDERIGASIPKTVADMKAANKIFEPVSYEGADHGFMRAGAQPDATEPNKKARAAAWAKIKSLQPSYK
jgi:carboxymethylenebutenolidase